MRQRRQTHGRPRKDRGSALLVSLMVMVGLSLLGLSFVAISETESAISANQRNKTQTTHLSEAAAKTVVQWFQDPATMDARDLLPDNDTDFKTERVVGAYTGYYKPTGRLCDTPFGPREQDMLYGDRDHADISIFDSKNAESKTFLDNFNKTLFQDDDAGRVVAIRIYAPPNVGGANVNGFWVAGQRYGVATIEVTAEKRNSRDAIIAQSTTRMVLAPFPLPGPTGAVQALGNIATNGAYEVHWGSVESEDDATETYVKREFTSFPWFDAYDRAWIEYGYDSSTEWTPNTAYSAGQIVRPRAGGAYAALAPFHEYVATNNGTSHAATEPVWVSTPGGTIPDNAITWKERVPTSYPIQTTAGAAPYTGYRNHNWLAEMLKREVEDPWFEVRTRGRVDGKEYGKGPVGDPHPYDYATEDMADAGNYSSPGDNQSHYFQYQTIDNRPLYKRVEIPKFDYDFWKAAAIAGRGQKGVYYLQWDADASAYTNGVKTQSFEKWIEEGPGFFFFDTVNGMNPQNGGPGKLVNISVSPCGARGVVYANVKEIKSTGGCDGTEGWYNQPGEPYRDIGYRRVNEVSSGMQLKKKFATDAAGNYISENAYNSKWDYQDLPWSNGAAGKNDVFDVCLAQRPLRRESTGSTITEWVPLPYFPDCDVGNNISMGSCNCSEPHEPYLNLRYDGTKMGIQAYWDNPNAAGAVYPKVTGDEKPTGTPVTCAAADVSTKAGQEKCATNAWDKRGALAWLAGGGGSKPPSVEGVVYNEGDYVSTGNAAYYGAIVVGGEVNPKGTQEIWYDSCLASDCWPPKHIPFPRVMITSTQID